MAIQNEDELSQQLFEKYRKDEKLAKLFASEPEDKMLSDAFATSRSSNHAYVGQRPTVEKLPANQKMRQIYFYHMKFSPTMELSYDIYKLPKEQEEDHTREDMKTLVQAMANGESSIKPISNPADVEWNQRGYLVFMLDHENWEWHHEKLERGGGMIRLNASMHCAEITDKNGMVTHFQNDTFFNADEFTLSLGNSPGDSRNRTFLFCENHHLRTSDHLPRVDRTGREDQQQDQNVQKDDQYKIDLYFRVKVGGVFDQNGAQVDIRETIIIDPTGRNTGPP